MDEERIGQALRALRGADSEIRAGTDAEVRAVLAFRRQYRRRGMQRLAVAAAIVVMGVVATGSYGIQHAAHKVTTTALNADAVAVMPVGDSREVLTPFYPLMVSAPRLENGLIIRVTVPAAVMRRVGLPVGDGQLADPVQADVLVGQDDLARAIRFVTYKQ